MNLRSLGAAALVPAILVALLVGAADPLFAFHFPWDQGHDTFTPNDPPDPPDDCDKCNGQGSPFVVGTGAYRAEHTDFFVPGRISLEIVRIYHGGDQHNGMFGLGWTFNYGVRLIDVTDGVDRHVIVRRENGQRDRFLDAGGTLIAPPDVIETLTRRGDGGFTLAEQDTGAFEFDSDGLLERIEDRWGNAVSFTYDGSGFLTAATDDNSRSLTFTKGPNGKIASIGDPLGRSMSYSYDADGRLISVTDPTGAPTTYEYDAAGNLTRIVDPDGNVLTEVTYDALGRVGSYSEQGETFTLTHVPAMNLVEETDSQGRTRQLFYNDNLNLTRVADQLGGEELLGYDSQFNVTSATDANGNVAGFTYDANGNFLSITDALGEGTSFSYEPNFRLLEAFTDARGSTTSYTYDANGNITSITDPLGAVRTKTYSPQGDLLSETDSLGNTTRFEYDANGYLTRITDPLGNVTLKTYDSVGNVTSFTDALGRTSTFEYDARDRLIRSIDAVGGTSAFEYDSRGNLVTFTDANGKVSTYQYDAFNRLTDRTDPLGFSESMQYDTRGNLVSHTDANGAVTTYTYDALDRLITKSNPDNVTSFTYDAVGNLFSASDDDTELQFAYDGLNRLIRVETAATATQPATAIDYAYDAVGNRVSMTDPFGGVTTYTYDVLNRLVRVIDPAGRTTAFSYDTESRRISKDHDNGTSTQLGYDAVGRLASLTNLDPGSTPLSNFLYSYDGVGNRISIQDQDGVNSYSYDGLDRLVTATHPRPENAAESYAYDAEGNRVASHLSSAYVYDAANRLLEDDEFAYGYDANGNPTTRTSKTTAAVTTYDYDADNQLVRIDFPDGSFVAYGYDALGRRVERRLSSGEVNRFIYDGADVLMELDGTDALVARYTHGPDIDEPILRDASGVEHYFHADGLGSIVQLTDPAGGVAGSYLYDSFGSVVAESGGVAQPYRFTGRELDDESGLYFYRARYYEPSLGRYLSRRIPTRPPDPYAAQQQPVDEASIFNPAGGDFDLAVAERLFAGPTASITDVFSAPSAYAYAFNNPVSVADPSGEWVGLLRALAIAGRAAARYARQAARWCKKVRCKIEIHGPHHYFGWPFNKKMCHVQLNCWIKGKKGSGMVLRIPYECGK